MLSKRDRQARLVSVPAFSIDQLVDLHPRLFHMAGGGSWPGIAEHGLLPTSHLVATAGLTQAEQAALLDQRRSTSTTINHTKYGKLTIRDQLPLRLQFLTPKLTDLTTQQWLNILNDRVFFWLHPTKLAGLLGARAYRGREQDVLTLDTDSLVRAHTADVRLSPINSGSALYPNAPTRGSDTFARIEDYPYASRRKGRSVPDAIAELAVIGGVPDLADHVLGVNRYIGLEFQHSIVGEAPPL